MNPLRRALDYRTLPPQLLDYRLAARPTEVTSSTQEEKYLLTGAVDLEAIEGDPPLKFELLEFGERWEMSIGPPIAEADLSPRFAFVGIDDPRPLGGLELGWRTRPVIIVGMMTVALSRPGIIASRLHPWMIVTEYLGHVDIDHPNWLTALSRLITGARTRLPLPLATACTPRPRNGPGHVDRLITPGAG